jgi:putative Holliday junction resolvase
MTKKILGLDIGAKKIGVAVAVGKLIFEKGVLGQGQSAVKEILRLVKEEGVEKIIIGLPVLESGKEGMQAKFSRRFAAKLASKLSVPILFVDERFSSFEAEKRLREMGLSTKEISKRIDSMSAKIILEDYLNKA